MIPETFIQELLARIDVVEVVGQYVQLRRSGANLLGLCPFHNEKTPSFTVSPDKQFYHCFGCGAHGSAIQFLMQHTGASFPEAVQRLAGSMGLQVPQDRQSSRQRAVARQMRQQQLSQQQVLEQAQDHYRAALSDNRQAIAYLRQRGLNGRVAEQYGLGWASAQRQGLARVFANYDAPALLEAGLVSETSDGQRHDRFRGRIMFPIRNQRGHLIGFGGRLIDKGEPKYLNSPETSLFIKGNELYGVYEARQGIRKEGFVLVVEGYMDVVVLARHGLENAVATLGTATTARQVQKLRRASERIVFCFDGDNAGRTAAWRAMQACLPWLAEDVSFRFLFLPPEHDPDSFVREHGIDAMRSSLDDALPLSRFLLDELARRHDLDEAEGRASCVHEARPLFEKIPPGGFRLQLERELAICVRLTPEELVATLGWDAKAGSGHQSSAPPAMVKAAETGRQSFPADGPDWRSEAVDPRRPDQRRSGRRSVTPMARRLLSLLLAHPELAADLSDPQLELLAQHPHLHLVREMINLVSSSAGHAGALLQAVEPDSELHQALHGISSGLLAQDLPDPQAEWEDAMRLIEYQAVQQQCDRLVAEGLETADTRRHYQHLLRRLAALKQRNMARSLHD